ncbi:integrator complex subunit 12 [Drosophila novamexicana]|uniref:integrator complex subunit 12 n=1 Tax=Drosophila novamexicana TaxID=47314 RepID=UPI0011E5B4D9|nr:integrator complex subunit 12 [Drosophila novamexicana]
MAANIAAAAAAAQEVDPVLKKAIKLLHSSNPTSAAELRLLLDEALKLRFGPEKMISKNMTQRMMDDEANFPGRATPQPPAQPVATDEIINLTNSPDKVPSDSPDTIADSDDGSAAGLAMSGVVNTGDTGDFGDLNCCVCGEMVYKATNRLIECSDCGALYHQECHKPPITNEEAADDQVHIWQCDTCCNKPSTSRAAASMVLPVATPTVVIPDEPMPLASGPKTKSSVPSSRSSTSSNSSSPFYKPEPSSSTNASSSSSSKHGHKSSSSSSSKSHKEERSSKSVAPAINTISAPEKHTSSSSGTSSSRRGSSTAKSSKSKHHESSSSSKRRAK